MLKLTLDSSSLNAVVLTVVRVLPALTSPQGDKPPAHRRNCHGTTLWSVELSAASSDDMAPEHVSVIVAAADHPSIGIGAINFSEVEVHHVSTMQGFGWELVARHWTQRDRSVDQTDSREPNQGAR